MAISAHWSLLAEVDKHLQQTLELHTTLQARRYVVFEPQALVTITSFQKKSRFASSFSQAPSSPIHAHPKEARKHAHKSHNLQGSTCCSLRLNLTSSRPNHATLSGPISALQLSASCPRQDKDSRDLLINFTAHQLHPRALIQKPTHSGPTSFASSPTNHASARVVEREQARE